MASDDGPGTNLWQPQKPVFDWNPYLPEDERLVWQGQPGWGLKLDKPTCLQFLFGLIFWDAFKRKRTDYASTSGRASLLFAENERIKNTRRRYTIDHRHIGFRWIDEGVKVYRLMTKVQSGRMEPLPTGPWNPR